MSSKKRIKQFFAYLLSVCMVVSSLFVADVGTVEAGEDDTTTVYFYNPEHYDGYEEGGEGNEGKFLGVAAWAWKGDSNYTGGQWPGTHAVAASDLGEDWVKMTVQHGPDFELIISWSSDRDSNRVTTTITSESVNGNNEVYFVGANQYKSADEAKAATEISAKTVYFYNSKKWSEVHAHAWKGDTVYTTWPGVEASQVEGAEGWYQATVSANTGFRVLFNGAADDKKATEATVNDKFWIVDKGYAFSTQKDAEVYLGVGDWDEYTTVYFKNSDSWEKVYSYAYYGASNTPIWGAWPGIEALAATEQGEGWWKVNVPLVAAEDHFTIIFNANEDGKKTGDIAIADQTKVCIAGKDSTGADTAEKVGISVESVSVNSVTVTPDSLILNVGQSEKLSVVLTPANATNRSVSWNSLDKDVATVTEDGTVTAKGEGTTTITATAADGSGVTDSCTVTVTSGLVTGVELDKSSIELKIDEDTTLTATVLPADAANKTVSWNSLDEGVATVSGNGATATVTATGKGTTKIIVSTEDGQKTAECEVTVTIPVTGVTVSPNSVELTVGEEKELTASVAPANASETGVTWKSSNEAAVIVDANGKITAMGAGNATITATTKDGGTAFGTCEVTVNPIAVTNVTLNPTALELEVGGTATLAATVLPANATNPAVTWTTSNPDAATVTSGVVKAVKEGKATITATTVDGGKTATCEVTITAKKDNNNNNDNNENNNNNNNNNNNDNNNNNNNNGGDGTQQGGGTTPGNSAKDEKPANVAVTKITIKGDSKKIAAGKKITLTTNVTPENATDKSVTWSSSNTKYATVSAKGVVTTKKAGAGKSVTITATAKDGSGIKATYKITIMKKAVTKIKLKASKTTVKAGKKVTVKATVTPASAKQANKTLAWKSSNTKYATVSAKGVVTTKKAGKGKKVKITATATDGSGKKASVTIKIK